MARRRYYYRRVVRPKQRWAINNVDVRIYNNTQATVPGNRNAFFYQTVVANGSRVQTTDTALAVVSTAQILKCGRFKFRGCLPNSFNYFSVTVFIAYAPEGYDLTTGAVTDQTLFYQHPEWVIGWTRKDYLNSNQSNEISITSRLKRNLNTNDQIIVGVLLNNTVTSESSVGGQYLLQGTLSYCCRAN